MTDEEFLDSLKKDARNLRYEPVDPFVLERIRARIADRLEPRVSALDLLAGWSKGIAASLAAAALALTMGFYTLSRTEPVDILGEAAAELAVLTEGVFGVD